jgi:simple sugar transport system substrate-binding protein
VVPGLVSAVETFAHEAAYVAGVVAGTVTRTNTVGIVVSGETPTWNYMTVGFAEGLHSVKPGARLLYGVIGQAAFEDAPGGKRLTEAQLAAGADVVFGQGDGASFGMINAIGDANRRGGGKRAWFIDVIGDKRDIDRDKSILTSVLFDYNGVYEEMVGDVGRGKFGRIYTMNLANHGVRLLDLPAEVGGAPREAAQAAREQVVSGKVKVSLIGAIPEMRKRLRELFPASIQ